MVGLYRWNHRPHKPYGILQVLEFPAGLRAIVGIKGLFGARIRSLIIRNSLLIIEACQTLRLIIRQEIIRQ